MITHKFLIDKATETYNLILNNKERFIGVLLEYHQQEDDSINVVFIATRHKSHGGYVINALLSGKNVFVEKPLCITREELDEIRDCYGSSELILSVGFNRRFSPYSAEIKKFFSNRSVPFVINYRVNAGTIPEDHWLQDPEQGGRIIGEACHFIDLVQFITDSNPVEVYTECIDGDESCSITIKFEDGSISTISYLANGDSSLAKEQVEFFCGGKTAVLDNWQKLWLYKDGKRKKVKFGNEKGHQEEINAFLNSVQNGIDTPIPFQSIYMTTLTTFKIHESLEKGQNISLL